MTDQEPDRSRRGDPCPLSRHATTHIDVLRRFLGVRIDVAPEPDGRTCLVRVSPPG